MPFPITDGKGNIRGRSKNLYISEAKGVSRVDLKKKKKKVPITQMPVSQKFRPSKPLFSYYQTLETPKSLGT